MCQRLFGAILLAVFVALLAPALNAQGGKKPGKNSQPPLDSAKLGAGDFVGKLVSAPGADRTFIMTVEIKSLVPTGKGTGRTPGAQQVQNLQNKLNQAQNQLARAKKASQQQAAMNRIASLQTQLQNAINQATLYNSGALTGGVPPGYKLVTNIRDVEFQHVDEMKVKVRTMILPEQFDDKGEPKKYTAEEKQKLKGKDKRLPGYESSLEKLEVGQVLTVTLAPYKRPAKKSEKTEKADDAPKDKAAAEDDGEKKMQVKMLIITKEADTTTSPGDRKGKK